MSVRHHISDELLLDYASGSLAESWSLRSPLILRCVPNAASGCTPWK